MFRITRSTGVAALLVVSALMPWSSDALAAGQRWQHAIEHRHTVTRDSCRAHHPESGFHARYGHHGHARHLVQTRDRLLERGMHALFGADFERAGRDLWRARRVEEKLHRLRRENRRNDCRPHRDDRDDRDERRQHRNGRDRDRPR